MSYILLIMLAILQVLDIYTTKRVLDQGGREVNPVMRWLMDKIGIMPALVSFKIAIVGAFVVCVIRDPANSALVILLAVLVIAYTYVVGRNYTNIK